MGRRVYIINVIARILKAIGILLAVALVVCFVLLGYLLAWDRHVWFWLFPDERFYEIELDLTVKGESFRLAHTFRCTLEPGARIMGNSRYASEPMLMARRLKSGGALLVGGLTARCHLRDDEPARPLDYVPNFLVFDDPRRPRRVAEVFHPCYFQHKDAVIQYHGGKVRHRNGRKRQASFERIIPWLWEGEHLLGAFAYFIPETTWRHYPAIVDQVGDGTTAAPIGLQSVDPRPPVRRWQILQGTADYETMNIDIEFDATGPWGWRELDARQVPGGRAFDGWRYFRVFTVSIDGRPLMKPSEPLYPISFIYDPKTKALFQRGVSWLSRRKIVAPFDRNINDFYTNGRQEKQETECGYEASALAQPDRDTAN